MPESAERDTSLLIAGTNAAFRRNWSTGIELRYALREVAQLSELEQRLSAAKPDILLHDLTLCVHTRTADPPPLTLLSPATKILVLTDKPSTQEAIAALKFGAKGYCGRDIPPILLRKAIEMIREGQVWLERTIVPNLLDELASATERRTPMPVQPTPRNPGDLLTRGERDVLDLIANGATDAEIAHELAITEAAVTAHIHSIYKKFSADGEVVRSAPAAGADGSSLRILLVDDNQHSLAIAAMTLGADAQMQIVGRATTGREALEQVKLLQPDLVVMDLAMPEMDGLQATIEIKKLPGAPRIIIQTFHDEPEYRTAALSAGADGFISKDHLVEELLPTIHRLLTDPARRRKTACGAS